MEIKDRRRGITLLLVGLRIWPVAAVCVRSIRQFWDGPITLFTGDTAGAALAEMLGHSLQGTPYEIVPFEMPKKKHACYTAKPMIAMQSPYENTIQIDVDTLVVAPFDELWPKVGETVVTMFGNWVTTGPIMRSRLAKWTDTHFEASHQMEHSTPAINTGVVAWGREGRDCVIPLWEKYTRQHEGEFIADEIAMQMLINYPMVRMVSDEFNCSPIHGAHKDASKIWHFHGKKHLRDEAIPIWWPAYIETCREDFGRINSWTPAGDVRLRAFLQDRERESRIVG